jgi:hypothetical protein
MEPPSETFDAIIRGGRPCEEAVGYAYGT